MKTHSFRVARARKDQTEQAEAWNHDRPVGTPVQLRTSPDGTPAVFLATKTRTPAWVLGDGTAVVSVEGKTGGWELERVFPDAPATATKGGE